MKEQFFGKYTGKLGYGNMRLPRINGELDYKTMFKMVDTFMEAGYTYIDTCHVYDASEKALGETLVSRYPREQFELNTKLSLLWVDNAEDMQKQFDESRRRLRVDYVDYYFIHALNRNYLKKADELDVWGFLHGLKEKGLARHIGFSFHDTPDVLDKVLADHPETELVLLQLNYLDWDDPKIQSRGLYETARKYNVPISVMEPCKGGWLASEVSESGKLLKSANPDMSVASWAFRFLGELPGIMTILSGMGTTAEVEDNLKTFNNFKPLSEEEHKLVKKAVEIIRATPSSPCTSCRYCVPHCPKKISIPESLNVYNSYLVYKDLESMKHLFYMMGLTGGKPQDCVKCGACNKICPQLIDVSNFMEIITELANSG